MLPGLVFHSQGEEMTKTNLPDCDCATRPQDPAQMIRYWLTVKDRQEPYQPHPVQSDHAACCVSTNSATTLAAPSQPGGNQPPCGGSRQHGDLLRSEGCRESPQYQTGYYQAPTFAAV